MSDPTDRLATVRAALDLMLRAWPGSLDVRRFVDDTGNDAAAVIDKATGETIAICDNEDRDDHAAPAEDAAAIVALRNAAPAIADLCREVERLREYAADLTRRREASIRYGIELQHLIESLSRGDEPDISERAPHAGRVAHAAWKLLDAARARIATLEAELAREQAETGDAARMPDEAAPAAGRHADAHAELRAAQLRGDDLREALRVFFKATEE